MKSELVIPKLSQTMEVAIISELLVKTGDFVKEGQLIANAEADKVNAELTAEKDGYVEIACEVDDEIEVGKAYAYLYDSPEEIGK